MTKIRQNSQWEPLIHLTGITAGLLSFLHLKYAHPVSGVGLEGSIKGVAAGDLGRRWVWVGYVDEHHLGVGGCWGVCCCCCCCLCCSCLCGALHADLKSASKQMKTDGETTCHDSDWWQQVPQDGLWYHREPHRCLYKRHSSCCCCFFLCFCARTVFVPLVSKVITHTYWLQNTSPELKQSRYFIWEQFPSTGELFKSLTLTLNLKINNKNKGNRKWVEKWPHPKDYLMIIFTHDTVFQTLCVLINTTFM